MRGGGPIESARTVARYATETCVAPLFDGRIDRAALDRRDLRELSEREGTFFVEYDGEERYTIAPPETVPPDGPDRGPAEARIRPPFVCEVPDVDLIGPQALPIRDGRIVYENMLKSSKRVTEAAASALVGGHLPVQRTGGERIEAATVLVGPWHDNFFHWFADYLSRLEGFVHYRERTGTDPPVLVPPDPPAWLRDSLRAVGLGPGDTVPWHGGRATVERLVVPSIRREVRDETENRRALYSPRGFRWLARRITDRLDRPSGDLPDRVYVSRADATTRRVDNERAVMRTLSARGFERVVLGDLAFAEQVALFRGADVVVAPHGAGLINMMYADDLDVVELVGVRLDLEKWGPFHSMADTLGFRYGCVVGDRIGCDIRVDTTALATLVDRMLDG